MKRISLALAVLFACFACSAQSAPTPLPGYNVSLMAGYTSTSGSGSSGMFASLATPVYTFGGAFGKNWDATIAARVDYFTISSPSTFTLTGGPEFRLQFSKASLLNGTVFQPFANAGLGASESQCVATNSCITGSDSARHFAQKLGFGLDVKLANNITWRIIEADYIHSQIFVSSTNPAGFVSLNNLAQVSTGFGFSF